MTEENRDSTTNSEQKPVAKRDYSRAKILVARILQKIAYFCIALGIAAVICVIAMIIMRFWLQPSAPISTPSDNSGGWFWLMATGLAPEIIRLFQILIIVLGIMLLVWTLKKIIFATRKLVWRIADGLMKPLALVEAIFLLGCWTIGILGAWWLADAKLFFLLTIIDLGFLIIGQISLAIMHKIADRQLDFVRADSIKRR
ncbi:MAG: hypothetical protein LBM09_00715 [Candidatus Nomurabacteria bacterium]|nr:hypothetical protein [Candidatus Nomurabacteria bacterium]